MQIGAGLVRNTAKIKASAVSACSPPDNSDSVAGFLPGGLAMISSPASSGSSCSMSCSSAVPPPNNSANSFLKLSLTIWKDANRRARKLVGLAKLGLGRRQPIDGGAPGGGRGFDFADQGLALDGEFFRRSDEFGTFACRLVRALPERGGLCRRIVATLAPGLAFVGNGGKPVLGKLRLAGDRLRFAAD